jgi:hypothetical protein
MCRRGRYELARVERKDKAPMGTSTGQQATEAAGREVLSSGLRLARRCYAPRKAFAMRICSGVRHSGSNSAGEYSILRLAGPFGRASRRPWRVYPARPSMAERSVGSTRPLISSKRTRPHLRPATATQRRTTARARGYLPMRTSVSTANSPTLAESRRGVGLKFARHAISSAT